MESVLNIRHSTNLRESLEVCSRKLSRAKIIYNNTFSRIFKGKFLQKLTVHQVAIKTRNITCSLLMQLISNAKVNLSRFEFQLLFSH